MDRFAIPYIFLTIKTIDLDLYMYVNINKNIRPTSKLSLGLRPQTGSVNVSYVS